MGKGAGFSQPSLRSLNHDGAAGTTLKSIGGADMRAQHEGMLTAVFTWLKQEIGEISLVQELVEISPFYPLACPG
jgi:hypothetical protein